MKTLLLFALIGSIGLCCLAVADSGKYMSQSFVTYLRKMLGYKCECNCFPVLIKQFSAMITDSERL